MPAASNPYRFLYFITKTACLQGKTKADFKNLTFDKSRGLVQEYKRLTKQKAHRASKSVLFCFVYIAELCFQILLSIG
ncbi:MAG TPA: hypothetical protein DD391_08740 [Clostridiales bacterium]|nr:hypothetical protein [Clostridiales bacterium]